MYLQCQIRLGNTRAVKSTIETADVFKAILREVNKVARAILVHLAAMVASGLMEDCVAMLVPIALAES